MKISARNQLKGTIIKIQEGSVNSIVTIDLGNDNTISATISMDSVKKLELAVNREAYAIIKATEVMVATDDIIGLSARNKFKGTISSIEEGAVNAIVTIDLGTSLISSTLSMDSVKDLNLAVGKEAFAIIKATSVIVGVE